MTTILTAHLRIKDGVLEQLVVFNEDDAYLLGKYEMSSVDPEVFRDQPNHTMREWLKGVNHQWRGVPEENTPQDW